MATVHWPLQDVRRTRMSPVQLRDIPFILTAEEDYPEGINNYIYERVRGRVRALHGAEPNLVCRPLGRSSAYKLANGLADLITWGETERAHPSLGVIKWQDIRAWHIVELYQEALLQGFWSAYFFRHQIPSALNPRSVSQRVSAVLGCFIWMSREGFVRTFDSEPEHKVVENAKRSSLVAYHQEMRQAITNSVPAPQRAYRKAPIDLPLPSPEHLLQFFEAIPNVSHRLAVMQMFETGMRATEVVENTLIPGLSHQRDLKSGQWYAHPDWPHAPYILSYSMSDDRMIGVLPTREMAWFEDARLGYQCQYRILGKNRKIRRINIPPRLLQRIWKFVDSRERVELAQRASTFDQPPKAHVYLNRFGNKLSYHAIWESCDRANRLIKAPFSLTPHLMRHAYACYFLEQGIAEQARASGIDPHELSRDGLMQIGGSILMTIQSDLGHKEFETTRKYLLQVASGRVQMQAVRVWNNFLDRM